MTGAVRSGRDLMAPGRSVAYATRGMVSTSSPLATATALDILRRGGNAVDAGIAAGAVLCLCEPGETGIGGDCFALYAPQGGSLYAYNGSGRLPSGFSSDSIADHGSDLPGDLAAIVPIPGVIDGWCTLSEKLGRMPLAGVLEPAIGLAEHGTPIQERVAFDVGVYVDKIRQSPPLTSMFLDGDAPKAPGALYRNPALAATLKQVAENGREVFYGGEIGIAVSDFLTGLGGAHRIEDFAAHRGEFVDPVSADYKGYTVHQCPPNGQGVVALMILGLLEHLDLDPEGPTGPWRYHSLVEASRLAYRYRDAYLGDPAHIAPAWDRFLDPKFLAAEAARITPDSRLPDGDDLALPNHPNTVCLSVVDEDRNAFSFISSLFDSFGSGLMEPETGVLLHSRGRSFSMQKGHPNEALAGRRPLHTIIPGMVSKNGQVVMAYGVMGGHFQPVGHAQVVSGLIDYGLDLQQGLELPRLFPQDGKVWVETGIPNEIRDHLEARGHQIAERIEPVGGAQLVWIDHETGVLGGSSDSRKDGCALGY